MNSTLRNYREYSTVDKSSWGDGPWQQEPDKVQWIDQTTNLDCLIVRGPIGALCGYVGVPEGHPLHGKEYDEPDVEVHGGLTFANLCADSKDEARHICHVPAPGRPDHIFWFGFDCAHSGDYTPEPMRHRADDVYRDLEYVRGQVESLARQLI